jgi:hypothetical protein
VRKTPLRDGDGLGGQACVAVDLAPLAGQTPTGPGSDVAGKSAINNGKNIIKIVTILQWAHQIHMEVRKTPLRDGDGLGGQACMVVDLAPLAGQTPAGPGSDVAGKSAPQKTG